MKKNSKYFWVALALVLVCVLAACGEKKKDTLEGSLTDLMDSITTSADEALGEDYQLPITGPGEYTPETAELVTGITGLTTDELASYVEDAHWVQGMISTQAFEIVLIKCKSIDNAATVKDLVAKNFDPGKWVCVRPKNCTVIDSGSYVLLTVGGTEQCEAIVNAFIALSQDNAGESNVFYTGV